VTELHIAQVNNLLPDKQTNELVHFAYVTSLRVEGKETQVLQKSKTLKNKFPANLRIRNIFLQNIPLI
jgi:hypothetical protein